MQIEQTTQTKLVPVEEQVLQLTLSIEEAKVLLALGATSQMCREDFLRISDKEGKYKDNHRKCAALLADLFHAANAFLHDNE